jgi:hypothetical protein
MSTRAAWILCLAAGLIVVALTVIIGGVEGVRACDGVKSPAPMIRFEWVRNVDEVEALFGAEPCRSTLASAFDEVNRLDMWGYIPAFTLFQLLAAWALSGSGRRLAAAAALAAIVAAICDQAEDQILFAITASLPGEQGQIDMLFWLVRAKFALLAAAAACLGILLARRRDATRWHGMAMIAAAAVALAGLIDPRLLAPGIGIAWAALIFAAALQVVLVRPSSAASSSPRT